MQFSHPLARDAKFWPTGNPLDRGPAVLVIITTLTLDPDAKGFQSDKVNALSAAASEWVSYHQDKVASFVLINRAKDW